MKRRKRKIMAILLAFAMIFTMVDPSIFGGAISVQAEETNTSSSNIKEGWVDDTNTYNITSEDTMVTISNFCNEGNAKYLEANYVLYDDLDFTGDAYHNKINIGSSSNHFKGTFDGQGYSITGLSGDAQTAVNNGLFGVMEGATVKNLVIKNADYRSNQYGGVLAAQATDSIIQNVTIIDSSCKVASLGSVVGLITTGGLYGGALVGYAGNTKIYNCESRNTSVYVDTTGGVQALGGDGMYMGGLVGWLDDGGILEYSRVIGGEVSTEYYVAVGALAANTLYAGGVVGRLDGTTATGRSKILDCFSSAAVNYDGECYVSVGAGITGWAGGIVARVSGNNYEIGRCHYAGNIHGHLLNSVLVLPIIAMEDYYLGGVAGNVENYNADSFYNCYFNYDKAVEGNQHPTSPDMNAINGRSNNGTVKEISNSQYSNLIFFETFDFEGNVSRNTDNAAPFDGEHSNKWVIDPVNNMPVHGKRVEASMDFPGAGTITFAKTSIQEAQTTDTNEKSISQIAQVHADMNEALTLTATVYEGYVFKGWYLEGQEEQGYVSTNPTIIFGGDATGENIIQDYKDNSVYVADYKAQINFYDNNNSTIKQTVEYDYQEGLDINSIDIETPGAEYRFLGWSDKEGWSKTEGTSYTKDSLTSDKISDLSLVENGQAVEKSMNLYPVFISIANYNITVKMQSWQEVENNTSEQVGQEGTAAIKINETTGQVYITVEDSKGEADGFRFDGWYENDICVSKNIDYYLDNVDLNVRHQYEARYQYKITAIIPVESDASNVTFNGVGSEYGEFYFKYGDVINDQSIPKPGFNTNQEVELKYWVTTVDSQTYSKSEMRSLANNGTKTNIEVKKPGPIYGMVNIPNLYYSVNIRTDFLAATEEAKMTDGGLGTASNITALFKIKSGYNFKGFYQYNDSKEAWRDISEETLSQNPVTITTDEGYHTSGNTIILARVTANVNFHKVGGNTTTIERKYNSLLFCTDESKVENWDDPNGSHVKTPDYGDITGKIVGTGVTPTDESMYRNGYKFIGWTTDESIFIDKENYVVSSEAAVSGSLLDVKETRVTETMDVYPVYLKYDITLKTNFGELPEGTIEESTTPGEEDSVIFRFTGDGYEFADPDEWTVKENGLEIDATIIKNGDNIYTIKGLNTETGYEIIASCKATVTFNNKNGSEVKKEPYDYNEELGELPKPTQEVNSSETSISAGTTPEVEVEIFAGWKENSEYVTDKTLVTAPMNLHPEYVAPPSLECTINDSDTKIVVSQTGTATLVTSKEEGYEFAGWKWTANGESSIITVLPNEDGTYKYELTPEQARKGGTYTAQFNPIIKYMIPIIEEDKITGYTELVESISYNRILNNENAETATAVLKVLESLRGTPYVFEGITDENNQIWSWSETKCVDDSGKLQAQTPYKENVDSTIVVYPIISEEEDTLSAKIFSNLEDGEEVAIDLVRENGKITLPEDPNDLPEGLVVNCAKGINDAKVEAQFVGYSLVSITTTNNNIEISRTSDALYAPGDTIYVDQIESYATTATKVTDKGNKVTARIYAVWAQVQNISGARMYFGGGTPSFSDGLISAVAVNTEILSRAGLQNGQTCSYKRSVEYHLGKNKITAVVGQSDIWDNDLYKMYFDKSFNTIFSQNSWNIYTSVTTNLKEKFYSQKISISPYLTFVYTKTDFNSKIDGNVYVEENTVTQYSYNEVASELLRLSEYPENQYYEWAKEEHKEQLKKFAGN